MPNNFISNITQLVARVFLEHFENARILSKNVDTQLFAGKFTPAHGDRISVKRPTDYVTVRTPTGDLSGEDPSPIVSGQASATVQDYFTTYVNYDEADEAIRMDQLDELLAPKATRIVTDLELDFARFMMRNSALVAGTVGTAITKWDHIAEQGAVLESHGVPMDGGWCSAVNSFTQRKLSSDQRSLGAGGTAGGPIKTAQEMATLTQSFAGMKVMTATTLASLTTHSGSDRAGVLAAAPDVTYLAHKDSMIQALSVSGFTNRLQIRAGEIVEVTGRNRLNLSTRQPIVDDDGGTFTWTGTVTQDVTLSNSGAGTLMVTGPAIYEDGGAYNTVDSALAANDVVTLLGARSTLRQPALFWHKKAFTLVSVPIKKLRATDTVMTTKDMLQMRVTRDSDFIKNQQMMRIDLRPAYGVMNPFFAGQGFGRA